MKVRREVLRLFRRSTHTHTHPAEQGVTCQWGEDENDKKWKWNEHEDEMRTT